MGKPMTPEEFLESGDGAEWIVSRHYSRSSISVYDFAEGDMPEETKISKTRWITASVIVLIVGRIIWHGWAIGDVVVEAFSGLIVIATFAGLLVVLFSEGEICQKKK